MRRVTLPPDVPGAEDTCVMLAPGFDFRGKTWIEYANQVSVSFNQITGEVKQLGSKIVTIKHQEGDGK